MDASKSLLAAKDRMALRELACMWAQELGVTPDDAAPGGFLAHSFAGDDPIVCKDFARQKLGLEPFKPNGEGRPRPPFPPKGEGLDFTIGERISMDETISLDDWEDVRAMIERKRAGRAGEPEPFNPADLDYFPPGEPWRNGPDARAPRKPPSRVIGAGTFMRSYAPISYTLGGVLPSGYLYGLTAKQGSGKTALKIAATLAVAMNRRDILGLDVESGRVAYVTIENPTDFKMKLAVNCFFHNFSYDEIETRIAIIDGRDTPEQIYKGLRLDAEANGDLQLVCFDTFAAGFAAAGAGAFNDNEAVLNYVIRLRPLTTLPALPSVLVAFGPTKNAGETS
jgi:hypothetical protein